MDRADSEIVVTEQVTGFFSGLFEQFFSVPFRGSIASILQRNAVLRQVDEAADAASQSLTRLFLSEQISEEPVSEILDGLDPCLAELGLAEVGNPDLSPESMAKALIQEHQIPSGITKAGLDPVFRIALHGILQVLGQVGPIMAEWQRLAFSRTFELPRRVVDRPNQISEQLGSLGGPGRKAGDDYSELLYRDYLLQRFDRVEAGTVKMTTKLDVDLRKLFVMPRVRVREDPEEGCAGVAEGADAAAAMMNLQAARTRFAHSKPQDRQAPQEQESEPTGLSALEQVRSSPRMVIIGAPGSGKSTFLEWLQLELAAASQALVMNGRQGDTAPAAGPAARHEPAP